MIKTRVAVYIITSAIVGTILTCFYLYYAENKINIDWQQLAVGPSNKGIVYHLNAILEPDIPLPNVKKLKGKGKFIFNGKSQNKVQFGYIVNAKVENLDVSSIPDKYRKERFIGKGISLPPIEQVTYKVCFDFELKDIDGFHLLSLESQPHIIRSGQENKFQSILEEMVPINIARRTNQIFYQMVVIKCLSREK